MPVLILSRHPAHVHKIPLYVVRCTICGDVYQTSQYPGRISRLVGCRPCSNRGRPRDAAGRFALGGKLVPLHPPPEKVNPHGVLE